MSGIMEGGVKYVKSPGDIYRYMGVIKTNKNVIKVVFIEMKCLMFCCRAVQPVLYKAVFHGGFKSMWSSVMEVR